MARLVMKEITQEMYIGVCLQCTAKKFVGSNPALLGAATAFAASSDAREHVRETGHTVRGVFRTESVWRPTAED